MHTAVKRLSQPLVSRQKRRRGPFLERPCLLCAAVRLSGLGQGDSAHLGGLDLEGGALRAPAGGGDAVAAAHFDLLQGAEVLRVVVGAGVHAALDVAVSLFRVHGDSS